MKLKIELICNEKMHVNREPQNYYAIQIMFTKYFQLCVHHSVCMYVSNRRNKCTWYATYDERKKN